MRVYIAGPMRGLPDWNFPAFDAARKAWTEAGHTVFCPAQLFRAHPYAKDETTVDRTHLLHVIQTDLACLYAADAIALLPGWQRSVGATVELAMAQFLALDVYDACTMELMRPRSKPWASVADSIEVVTCNDDRSATRCDFCKKEFKGMDVQAKYPTLHEHLGRVCLCSECYYSAGNTVR